MQFPSVPFSELTREGRITPLVHSLGVLMCIVGIYLGAFFPPLAAAAGFFTIIATALGGISGAGSAWNTYQQTKQKQNAANGAPPPAPGA